MDLENVSTVSTANSTDSAPLVQDNCGNDPSLMWKLDTNTGYLTNGFGKCVAVEGPNTNNLSRLLQYDCRPDPSLEWKLDPLTNYLTNGYGKCVAVTGANNEIKPISSKRLS